ncbi:hypothetical protein KKP97_06935, partial [Methanothermococcus sp. SCGC AD-155-C09]|nr:hypothetical protein [Methanothermococcus sp. SCGC AD-155-C09]
MNEKNTLKDKEKFKEKNKDKRIDNEKVKIKVKNEEKEFEMTKEGLMKLLKLPIRIEVAKGSFLHIGAAPSPLTEKKGAVFKVDRTPVIPATSFKGALRHQLELLFIEKIDDFEKLFNILDNEKEVLKPCIPSPEPTKSEEELIGKYRKTGCQISVNNDKISIPKIDDQKKDKQKTGNKKKDEQEIGICPVCYFMGSSGIIGFLRFNNFYPEGEGKLMDQTNIRIDRKTGTTAHGAKVEGEQVKPGTVFKGNVDIVISEPVRGLSIRDISPSNFLILISNFIFDSISLFKGISNGFLSLKNKF